MNVRARIMARKVMLAYYVESITLHQLATKRSGQSALQEAIQIDNFYQWTVDAEQLSSLQQSVRTYQEKDDDSLSHVEYLIDNFFSYPKKPDIDYTYIKQLVDKPMNDYETIQKLVDIHTTTFWFEQMDIADQAIFLLWYRECLLVETPKEVVINEMVELAKRYGDDGAAKLVNGILHKVLAGIDKTSTTQQ